MFGNCTKIKSQLLSGELDGVCMYIHPYACCLYEKLFTRISTQGVENMYAVFIQFY